MDEKTEKSPKKQRRPRRRMPAQIAKNEATRARLLQATAEVIGEHGFAKATIDAITKRAGIAHGAFYFYFSSRQHAFDQALEDLGQNLIDAVSAAVKGSPGIMELEQRGFAANIAFAEKHVEMHRIMTEAELYAPEAYARFMKRLRDRYINSLRRSMPKGDLAHFDESELETVAVLLMGMRRAFLHAYCLDGWELKTPPPDVFNTFMKFLSHGLKPAAVAATAGADEGQPRADP